MGEIFLVILLILLASVIITGLLFFALVGMVVVVNWFVEKYWS